MEKYTIRVIIEPWRYIFFFVPTQLPCPYWHRFRLFVFEKKKCFTLTVFLLDSFDKEPTIRILINPGLLENIEIEFELHLCIK